MTEAQTSPLNAACPVCRGLRDREGGVARADGPGIELPAEARRLVRIAGPVWLGTLEKCPECGTVYSLSQLLEYAPDGIEEEVVLRRLSLEEALSILMEGELFEELLSLARRSPNLAVRVRRAVAHSRLDKTKPAYRKWKAALDRLGRPPSSAPS